MSLLHFSSPLIISALGLHYLFRAQRTKVCHQIIRVDLWALWASASDEEELDVGGGKLKTQYFAASASIKSSVTCSVKPVINQCNIPPTVLVR